MKKALILISIILLTNPLKTLSQENKPKFEFYGFIRADLSFDNHVSAVSNEGLFFLYPLDINSDENGEDLNAQSSLGFYSFNTRPGVNISGFRLFDSDVTARIEADFAGFGGQNGNSSILRIRLAYIKMNWEKSSLLIGQDWHPFFGPVTPGQISLSTGAPFNAFNRSPQIRFDYTLNKISLSGSALYQFQMISQGPIGKSTSYQKNAMIPELAATVDFKTQNFIVGAGINFLSLKPRTQSTFNGKIYKVDEMLHSLSYTAYMKYNYDLFSASIKTTYGQNPSNLSMLGGYGVKSIDSQNGKQEYTNFNSSASWLNLSYGKKYLINFLAGYSKNLGSVDKLVENSPLYGEGMSIDNLYRIVGTFSYNIPHFKFGLEYEFSNANYGDSGTFNWETGKYASNHGVKNSRILALVVYTF